MYFEDEYGERKYAAPFEVHDRATIAGLFSSLETADAFGLNHEAPNRDFVVRFETRDGRLAAHQLEVWTQTNRGQAAILIPALASANTLAAAGTYASVDFVRRLKENASSAEAN